MLCTQTSAKLPCDARTRHRPRRATPPPTRRGRAHTRCRTDQPAADCDRIVALRPDLYMSRLQIIDRAPRIANGSVRPPRRARSADASSSLVNGNILGKSRSQATWTPVRPAKRLESYRLLAKFPKRPNREPSSLRQRSTRDPSCELRASRSDPTMVARRGFSGDRHSGPNHVGLSCNEITA